MVFQNVTVLGAGLLGGSVALAALEVGLRTKLWGRRAESVATAVKMRLEATTDLRQAVVGAELIILAVPVGAMPGLLSQVLPLLNTPVIFSDVGSVKVRPNETLVPLLEGTGHEFIGSHPMAGSEQTGMEAARKDLLQGAACILTPSDSASQDAVTALEVFWRGLGCVPRSMSSAAHDEAVARVSHFPHAMAAVTADISLSDADLGQIAGGGLRDTSRVAGGDPHMWTEIMMENRVALIESLKEGRNGLESLIRCLEGEDSTELCRFLTHAKSLRDQL